MNKQKTNKENQNIPLDKKGFRRLSDFNLQAIVLIIIGFIFYANTFQNQYALDDGIVIQKNDYVQQGFRGIPKIFKTDAYESFYRQMNAKQQLSGGRYRPLSVATFAVEQQLFGSKEKVKPDDDIAIVRHFLNVAFYVLSVVLLLYFLQTFIFKETPLIAFLTCLIFLIHPMHTEVIANVKSRDEILSFLFIVLTFIAVFRYRETKKIKQLFFGLFFYFLALLSKEYAITLIVLIPILLFVVKTDSIKNCIISVLPFIFVAGIYILIRLSVVGVGSTIENPDVLNNPYKYAISPEKWATKIEMLNHYLKLLFYPYPLSSDYSYNTIPYTNFSNPLVWTSIAIHCVLILSTFVLFFKRHILAFALAFYLLHLFLISNLVMDIGATMGERLIYHSSFGFAIIIAFSLYWLLNKIENKKTKNSAVIILSFILVFACATVVIPRNTEWKNDASLFIADAETVPNSALVNGNAGKAYIDLSEKPEYKSREKEFIKKSIYHLSKAVSIHKNYVNGYLNLGVAYYKLQDYESAKKNWDMAHSIYPNNPYLKTNYHLLGLVYYDKAMRMGSKNPADAIKLLWKAIEIDSSNADLWYNLGGASFTIKDFATARIAWTKTLQIKPDYKEAQQGMSALPSN